MEEEVPARSRMHNLDAGTNAVVDLRALVILHFALAIS